MRTPLCLALAVLCAAPSQAQGLLHTLSGDAPNRNFGSAVAGVPDTDGDGRGDLLVGSDGAGVDRAYLYSGATGALRFALASPDGQDSGKFGTAVIGMPDVNGDGRGDFAVGAKRETVNGRPGAGRVYVFSGATGTVLYEVISSTATVYDTDFGYALASVPDTDGDGIADLLVAGERPAFARVFLFSGATGAPLHEFEAPTRTTNYWFGAGIGGVPDVDGDGRGEVLVGDIGNHPTQDGEAHLFSGATGALLRTIVGEEYTFGDRVAGVGDLDGDGAGDVLVATPSRYVSVYSGATGALLRTLTSPQGNPSSGFGAGLAGVRDADQDGVPDVLVGASLEIPNRAYIYSGADGALLQEIRSPGGFRYYGLFGGAVAGVPDATGDGRDDLLVGAAFEAEFRGRAYALSGALTAFGVAPVSLQFPAVRIGDESSPQVVTVENGSAGPLTLTAVTLTGAQPGSFAFETPPLPRVLQPGQSAALAVRFVPTLPGALEAVLRIEGGGGVGELPLDGTGQGALVVTTADDTFDDSCDAAHCSLRDAAAWADRHFDPDTIRFAPALAGQTIHLTAGEITFGDTSLDILAPEGGLTISGGGASRIFSFDGLNNGSFRLVGLTIEAGNATEGGGLRVSDDNTTLTLERCTVRGNTATRGGGVWSRGTLNLIDATISGNTATGDGGGVYVDNAVNGTVFGGLYVTRATISGNTAGQRGGGVFVFNNFYLANFGLRNATITDNSAGTAGGGLYAGQSAVTPIGRNNLIAGNDVAGNAAHASADCGYLDALPDGSAGFNVFGAGTGCATVGTDRTVPTATVFTQVLAPALAANGGPTLTHALQAGSPAVDLGGTCGPADQRGEPAPAKSACDAGAFEQQLWMLTAVNTAPTGSPIVVAPGDDMSFDFTVANHTQSNPGQGDLFFNTFLNGIRVDEGHILAGTTPPGVTRTGSFTVRVPRAAPAGAYDFCPRIGRFPDLTVESVCFGLVITGTQARLDGEGAAWHLETMAAAWDGTASADGGTGAASRSELPSAFALRPGYPNPFAARAVLGYDVPEATAVRITVYDVLGRTVAVLADGEVEAGRHEAVLDGSALSSGLYLVRMTTGTGYAHTERLTLTR